MADSASATQHPGPVTWQQYLRQLLLCLGLSVLAGSVIILATGGNPLRVYVVLVEQAFLTPRGLMIAVQRATPLIFTALAATLAFQGGAINMGIAGQFMVGSSVASMAAYALAPLPKPLHIALILLLSGFGGAGAAFVPAIFKRLSGVNEVITGMIANLLMPSLLSFVTGALRFTGLLHYRPASSGIPASARLRQFAELTQGGWGAGTKAHTGVFIAVALAFVLTTWLKHTKLGFEIRMTRANFSFAEFVGIRAGRMFFLAMMLSGAIAALAGAVEILGASRGARMGVAAIGDKGLVLALIGGQNFLGSMVAALFYGALEAGAMNVAWLTSISRPLIDIVIELIVLLAAFPSMRSFFSGSTLADFERLGGRFTGVGK